MTTVALYARVSSRKQAQEGTIASQVAELERKIAADGHELYQSPLIDRQIVKTMNN